MKKNYAAGLLATAMLSTGCFFALSASAEGQTAAIPVTVTVSNAGKLELTTASVNVTDRDNDGKYTIDEVLYAAHEAYYEGGAAAGYASETSTYGLSLKTLWGVTNGGSFGYYVNDGMAMSLADPVKEGDYIAAYVYSDTATFADKYSYFDVKAAEIKAGEAVDVTLNAVLFDEKWAPYASPVKNARITIDNSDSSFVTDENGKAKLVLDVPGTHIISAKAADMTLVPAVLKVTVSEAQMTSAPETTTAPASDTTADPAATTTETTVTTVTTTGSNSGSGSKTNNSGSTDAAKTGDTAAIPALAVTAVLACGAAFVFRKRND